MKTTEVSVHQNIASEELLRRGLVPPSI